MIDAGNNGAHSGRSMGKLTGKVVVFTGTLEQMTRAEDSALAKRLGATSEIVLGGQ